MNILLKGLFFAITGCIGTLYLIFALLLIILNVGLKYYNNYFNTALVLPAGFYSGNDEDSYISDDSDIYEGSYRCYDFLRDMADSNVQNHNTNCYNCIRYVNYLYQTFNQFVEIGPELEELAGNGILPEDVTFITINTIFNLTRNLYSNFPFNLADLHQLYLNEKILQLKPISFLANNLDVYDFLRIVTDLDGHFYKNIKNTFASIKGFIEANPIALTYVIFKRRDT